MDAYLVTMSYKPEYRDVFVKAMQDHARLSFEIEPGMILYEVMQDLEDPGIIYVYEIFVDEAAFDAHAQAPHNLAWRDKIKDWHGSDWFKLSHCVPVYPPDSERKKLI